MRPFDRLKEQRGRGTGQSQSGPRFRQAALVLGTAIGLLVLLGYTLNVEWAWRLGPTKPATHPMTAVCVVLIGAGMLVEPRRRAAPRPDILRAAAIFVICLGGVILPIGVVCAFFGANLLDTLSPFQTILARSFAAGHMPHVGTNSAIALLCIAGAHLLALRGRHVISQSLSCCAIGLGVVAATGYIDGVNRFYGGMAPYTLAAVLCLSIGTLFSAPRDGFLAPLIAQSDPGRLARLLLGSSTALVLLLGWVIARFVTNMDDRALLVDQSGAVIVLTWLLVTVATLRAESIDRRRHSAERSLLEAAIIDPVTGVLSRDHMWSKLTTPRAPAQQLAILFVDLDHFRSVSAVFGPESSDLLLAEIAHRLTQLAGDHEVGRLRSDEFAILCPGIPASEAEELGKSIIMAVAEPLTVRGRNFHMTASVGLAHSDICGEGNMLRAANEAMYIAKTGGGNQSVSYLQTMRETRKLEVQLGQDLYTALDRNDELSLAFQPIVSIPDNALIALEALARWTHPTLGNIPPDRFIQIAEKTGLMPRLGRKLMTMAVRQVAQWRERFPDACPTVNINISPLQFSSGDVISDLVFLLEQYNLPASRFCIEVTESAFASQQAAQALTDARQFGFKVAMDDFGVGYSSLSQIPLLPLTSIKLDRSFVVNATNSAEGGLILAAVVPLAHALQLKVVAEGVETSEQLTMVAQCMCDSAQGYLFSRPLKPADVDAWLGVTAEVKA